MLVGRLGLEKARIPHADRHGLVWLERGRLEVEDGCLRFVSAGGGDGPAGLSGFASVGFARPVRAGVNVTHDALRLLASHGTALAAIGAGGVRFYTAQPLVPDNSALARRQVTCWARPQSRVA